MESVIHDVQRHLGEFGIASRWANARKDSSFDFLATLTRGDAEQSYAVVVKQQITLAAVAAIDQTRLSAPLLIVGSRITARSADALHNAGIHYADASGNAFVNFGDVYVEVRGRRPSEPAEQPVRPASKATNIFSARRAQVICSLLAWPSLAHARVKDIAETAGVSIGQAHDTMGRLQTAGFLGPSGLRRQDDLLELWTAAYPTGLGATLELQRFVGDPSPGRVVGSDNRARPALSGEAAVRDLLGRQLTLTLYVTEFDPGLAVANRWRRDPQKPTNIFVRRRFWSGTMGPAEQDTKGQELAPWPLVYADLRASGDPRLLEVSKAWLSRHGA